MLDDLWPAADFPTRQELRFRIDKGGAIGVLLERRHRSCCKARRCRKRPYGKTVRLQRCVSCGMTRVGGIVQEEKVLLIPTPSRHSIGRAPVHEPQAVLPAVLAVDGKMSRQQGGGLGDKEKSKKK